MSIDNKYRVHEVAKDFKRPTKEITEILTKYATTPKNHMQALTDEELSIIFAYLTVNNQVDDMESVFENEVYHEPKAPEAPPAPVEEPKAEEAPAGGGGKPAQPPLQRPTTRVPEKRVVDTRKGGQVNLEKYDERLENIAAGRTQQMQAGKQKFQGRNQRRNNAFQSGKRRAEEQEKMRRLHAEIAKKHPLVVKIPDEINVGELASRMKKTAAEVVKTLMKGSSQLSNLYIIYRLLSWLEPCGARKVITSLSSIFSASSTPRYSSSIRSTASSGCSPNLIFPVGISQVGTPSKRPLARFIIRTSRPF